MEWIILSILVPVILAIVLLLAGFSGCEYTPPVASVATPSTLTEVDVGVTTVTLSWFNTGELSLAFEIERLKEGDVNPAIIFLSPFPTAMVETVDANVEPGTTYFYQVQAVRLEDDLRSASSNSIFVTTLS